MSVSNVNTLQFEEGLEAHINQISFQVSQENFEDESWILSDLGTQSLIQKLKKVGNPLAKYVDSNVFYGIKTGLNEAFVIDKETRELLTSKDINSQEIIKPFLAGRDVKRYQEPKTAQYLILFEKGFTNKNRGEMEAIDWFKNNYSALYDYLEPFTESAAKRYDQGDYWWELRACDYYQEFEKGKIIYPNICKKPEFTFDNVQLSVAIFPQIVI